MSRIVPRLLALLIAPLLAGASQAGDRHAAERIHAHVATLASDRLQGRDTGSAGHAQAADYVAGQFQALGLSPGGDHGGWYQQVPFRRAAHAAAPTASLIVGGKAIALRNGRDFAVRPSVTERQRTIDAPLVFVGHGVSEPRLGVDEYAGLDVRGKLVVLLRGAPAGLPDEVAAHLDVSKERTAAEHGAVGVVELSYGGFHPVGSRGEWPVLDWADASGRAGGSGDVRAAVALSAEWSRKLFDGAPRSFEAVKAAARSALPGFALPARLRIEQTSQWQDFQSPNVVGLLPGSDPAAGSETVVLMAHLDHLGIDPRAGQGKDSIFNGALDNAAGVATLIEAARSFTRNGHRPRRSIMFVASTGEERGLLGADYFVTHPPAPPRRLVALVNLDMPLLTYDFTDVIGFGADHSTIGRSVAEAGRAMGVGTIPDPMPQEVLFIRSDHYRFVLRGIPAIFLMTGYGNGGREAWGRYLGRYYHRVNDDLRQPIDWRVGAKFSELNYRLARSLADAPDSPRWYAGDYFGDRFAPGQPRATR